MSHSKLRQEIAAEAARLIVQRKESDYYRARRKAARWISRRRLPPEDLPSNAEIQQQVLSLAGLFAAESQSSGLAEMRFAAWELCQALQSFAPRLSGSAVDGPVAPGAEITISVAAASRAEVTEALAQAGYGAQVLHAPSGEGSDPAALADATIQVFHRFPCEITLRGSAAPAGDASGIDYGELQRLMAESAAVLDAELAEAAGGEPGMGEDEDYHPDAFPLMRMLLLALEKVKLDSRRHPEGDLLYHSLQTFELGCGERPYDEEFLLACLLHDVGYGIDRRNPLEGARQALRECVTERTWFLIEHRAEGVEYLTTGKIRGGLRRSEHFDDVVLLARCDLDGRQRGAVVRTVDEALDYIAGLESAWD